MLIVLKKPFNKSLIGLILDPRLPPFDSLLLCSKDFGALTPLHRYVLKKSLDTFLEDLGASDEFDSLAFYYNTLNNELRSFYCEKGFNSYSLKDFRYDCSGFVRNT